MDLAPANSGEPMFVSFHLPNSAMDEMVAWTWPGVQYVPERSQQMLKIRVHFLLHREQVTKCFLEPLVFPYTAKWFWVIGQMHENEGVNTEIWRIHLFIRCKHCNSIEVFTIKGKRSCSTIIGCKDNLKIMENSVISSV